MKFAPSIVIWNLEFRYKKDGRVLQNLYFFSYKRAKKFWERYEAAFEEYNVSLGGEQLWLW